MAVLAYLVATEEEDVTVIGSRCDETGTLFREGERFLLRRDLGGRIGLELKLVLTGKGVDRVRIIGVLVAEDLVVSNSVRAL